MNLGEACQSFGVIPAERSESRDQCRDIDEGLNRGTGLS
jgi:hypothetical protein